MESTRERSGVYVTGMIHAFFLLLVFLSEVAAIIAYGYWGFQFHSSTWVKWALGIGIPVVVIVVWGLFLSPKASVEFPQALRIGMKVMVFGFAAAALYAAGRPRLAFLFGLCVLVSHGMDYMLADK
ncbi:YrdB family protein [Brevibacillus centrosporus]|uniref:YrdB family protein n=1 Tax=Brevibacillus centrosporus TaxID=54910 RepID=UPI002E1F38CB|nr:YrdB family protein [Brevibacillus centrosporus]